MAQLDRHSLPEFEMDYRMDWEKQEIVITTTWRFPTPIIVIKEDNHDPV